MTEIEDLQKQVDSIQEHLNRVAENQLDLRNAVENTLEQLRLTIENAQIIVGRVPRT